MNVCIEERTEADSDDFINDSTTSRVPPFMRKLNFSEIDRPSPEEVVELPKHPVSSVLHNIRSIYNVGSMFRTSEAGRIEHLYLTGYTGTPEHEDLHKTALGTQDVVPWSKHEDVFDVFNDLRSEGYTLAALEITNSPTYPSNVSLEHFPLCMVVGNEVKGVDDDIIDAVDLALEIPQFGAKHSLNVGVAYGIALLDLVRRYRSLHGPPEEAP